MKPPDVCETWCMPSPPSKPSSDLTVDFDRMWPLTHYLCESLVFEPKAWLIQSNTIRHNETGISFWHYGCESENVRTFMYKSDERVFSDEQSRAITKAVRYAIDNRPNETQLQLLGDFARHLGNPLPTQTRWQRIKAALREWWDN